MWRVLVVDDVRVRRDGFAALLQTDPRFVDVAAASPDEIAALASSDRHPQVIILHATSSYSRRVLTTVRAAMPGARVIALGAPASGTEVVSCLEDGFCGYVPVEGSLDDLCTIVHAATQDELLCPPSVAFALLRRVQELRSGLLRHDVLPLTRREQEILELLEMGLSNKEIARRLSIRALTVKNHVHNILKKLGARRRGEAAAHQRRLLQETLRECVGAAA